MAGVQPGALPLFLYAGLPYLLGAAWPCNGGAFDAAVF
jgi:hypothetical protein